MQRPSESERLSPPPIAACGCIAPGVSDSLVQRTRRFQGRDAIPCGETDRADPAQRVETRYPPWTMASRIFPDGYVASARPDIEIYLVAAMRLSSSYYGQVSTGQQAAASTTRLSPVDRASSQPTSRKGAVFLENHAGIKPASQGWVMSLVQRHVQRVK